MTGAKESDDLGGRPTDRYQKVKPEGSGKLRGDHTPLATEVPDADGDELSAQSQEATSSESQTGEGGSSSGGTGGDRQQDAEPRKTQRYDPLAPADPDPDPDLTPADAADTAAARAAGDSTPLADRSRATPIESPANGRTPLVEDQHLGDTPQDLGADWAEEQLASVGLEAGGSGRATSEQPPMNGPATRAPTSRGDPMLGKMVGGLVLEEAIGRGGMGSIYRARHPHLRKEFAIKLLPERLAMLPPFVERFINEGRSASRITHPGAVRVSAAGVEGGVHFIIMELIKGRDLRRLVEDTGSFHEFEVRRIICEAARVIASAHSVGIIHRDIKPENLLLEDDTRNVRVTDFGLSMDTSADLASVEATIGTPNYMSPEQCMGKGCDERSDIYALGATSYFLLTRRAPFSGHTATAVMIRHIVEKAPDPRVYAPRTTDEFAELVLRMMRKDPAERFASALELVQAIEAISLAATRAVPTAALEQQTGATASEPAAGDLQPSPARVEAHLSRLLVDAQARRAESVHLVLQPDTASTEMRIDGALVPHERLSTTAGQQLADVIKAAAGIPAGIGQHRHGRLEVTTVGGVRVPVFVGVLPGAASERVVMRLLPVTPDYAFTRDRLGLSSEQERMFADWGQRSRGVVVATGPIDGGSQRVLYSLLAEIRHRPLAVATIEEQVDVLFDGVTQYQLDPDQLGPDQLDPDSGMNQAQVLRACMDQDIDVCMITNVETERWQDVFAAAQAGRLLLTGETRADGVSTLRHLLTSGVAPGLVEQLCLGIVTTRELPIACSRCLRPLMLEPGEMAALGLKPEEQSAGVPAPAGCTDCGDIGTVGRELVHEFFVPDRQILQALASGKNDAEVRTLAAELGATVPLRAILRERVLSGRTRISDALTAIEDLC